MNRLLIGMAIAVSAVSGSACHRPSRGQPTDTAVPARADSAAGIVQLVGSEPMTLTLAPPAGTAGETLVLGGTAANTLRPLAGLGVAVFGSYTASDPGAMPTPARGFHVTRFVVRSADGVAAHDGVIAESGSAFQLVRADGSRVDVPHLPPSLHGRVGTRIYLVGPLTAPPVAYGVISTP